MPLVARGVNQQVAAYIAQRGDLLCRDHSGETLLHSAVKYGQVQTLRIFCSAIMQLIEFQICF